MMRGWEAPGHCLIKNHLCIIVDTLQTLYECVRIEYFMLHI
jgi:hypothetical protein